MSSNQSLVMKESTQKCTNIINANKNAYIFFSTLPSPWAPEERGPYYGAGFADLRPRHIYCLVFPRRGTESINPAGTTGSPKKGFILNKYFRFLNKIIVWFKSLLCPKLVTKRQTLMKIPPKVKNPAFKNKKNANEIERKKKSGTLRDSIWGWLH